MKVVTTGLLLAPLAQGLNVSPQQPKGSVNLSKNLDRRASFAAFGAVFVQPLVASAGLLDEFGADPSKIAEKEKAAVEVVSLNASKGAVGIDPTLKGSYYYPTAKKRYLPRIKKVSDAIIAVPDSISLADWEAVGVFADKVADDAVLPLKLYVSSLDGQGLNMANSYAKVMKKDADVFEVKVKDLQKAVKKQDSEKAIVAVQGMSIALQEYREQGRLTGPDGGGDIPSVDEIRRSACRVQGRSFEQKIQARDARLKSEESSIAKK